MNRRPAWHPGNGADTLAVSTRPADDRLPANLRKMIADHDRLHRAHDDAQREAERLRDPQLDNEAAEADAKLNSDARRGGLKLESRTTMRDRLAADRQAAADEVKLLARGLADVDAETAVARVEVAESKAHRAKVDAARSAVSDALEVARQAVDEWLAVEAADDWLTYPGHVAVVRSQVPIFSLAPELGSRGIHGEDAGYLAMHDLFARLASTLTN
jgi:hypothetical protein